METVRLRRAGIDRLTVKTTSGTTRQVWRQSCESDEEGAQDNVWAGNKKEYSIQESVKEELDFFFEICRVVVAEQQEITWKRTEGDRS